MAVPLVVDASVHRAAQLIIVDAVVENLANVAVRAREGELAETDGNLVTLDARVAQVADHGVGVAHARVVGVGITSFVIHHSGSHEQGEQNKRPGHHVEDVDVSHNTEAELRDRILLSGLSAHIALSSDCLLFDNFAATDHNLSFNFLAAEQISHLRLRVALMDFLVVHPRQAAECFAERL